MVALTRRWSSCRERLGVAAPGNSPGARFQTVGWIDGADHIWVFGGYGRDATTADYFGALNDLFEF